jgi:hypothetical protein
MSNKKQQPDKPFSIDTIFTVSRFGNNPSLDIDGENLVYATMGSTHHGLQCNYRGNHPNHKLMLRKLKEVEDLLIEIETLNKLK